VGDECRVSCREDGMFMKSKLRNVESTNISSSRLGTPKLATQSSLFFDLPVCHA